MLYIKIKKKPCRVIKNFDIQIGQITSILNSKQSGTLPSDIERNLREHVKAITLRNGKELSDHAIEMKNNEESKVAEEEQKVEVQKPKEDEVILRRISFLDNSPSYVLLVPYP